MAGCRQGVAIANTIGTNVSAVPRTAPPCALAFPDSRIPCTLTPHLMLRSAATTFQTLRSAVTPHQILRSAVSIEFNLIIPNGLWNDDGPT